MTWSLVFHWTLALLTIAERALESRATVESDGGDEISIQLELDALFLEIEMAGSIYRQ